MFKKWEIDTCPMGIKSYVRHSEYEGILFLGQYREFFDITCRVSSLNYRVSKSNEILCTWYSTIFGRLEGDPSEKYTKIAESYIFEEEFLAVLWSDKKIKEDLRCEIEDPLKIPNIGELVL